MKLRAQEGETATKRLRCYQSLWSLSLLLVTLHIAAQAPPSEAPGGTIHGIVKSGNMPIPGAAVSISPASSPAAKPISSWTDVDGSFSASVAADGAYTVRVQMA